MLAAPNTKPAAAVPSAAEAPQTVVPKGSSVPEQVFRNADAPIFGTSEYVLVPGGTRVDGAALAE